jgi:magnesium transporter
MRAYFWDSDRQQLEHVSAEDLPRTYDRQEGALWVDLEAATAEEFQVLSTVFSFHPLALEDCRTETPLPKVEEYDDFLFIIMHAPNLATDTEPPLTREVGIFLRPHLLVTHHTEPLHSMTATREAVERAAHQVMGRGCSYLLYVILDLLVSTYFPIIDQLSESTEGLESRALTETGATILPALQMQRRDVMHLKRILGPQREVAIRLSRGEFPLIAGQNLFYFRDITDALTRINEELEMLRDLIAFARDSYLGAISVRLNNIMMVLTIIATIMMPATLIASIWGMNVWLPGGLAGSVGKPEVFAGLVAVMIAIGVAMMWWFRRSGWW